MLTAATPPNSSNTASNRGLVKDPSKLSPLEDYWQAHQCRQDDEAVRSPPGDGSPSVMREKRRRAKSSPNGQPKIRNRAISSASALAPPGQTLSAHHPATSFSTFLDIFGPLVFPLYKAALLRKRILLIGQAPVELACNFGKLLVSLIQPILTMS